MKRSWKIVGLALGALLLNAPPAFADLKSVFTAVCTANDDTLRKHSGPVPSFSPVCTGITDDVTDCKALMVCMDAAKWHVIHDTRYGGAWFEFFGSVLATPAGEARYKLIFQKD